MNRNTREAVSTLADAESAELLAALFIPLARLLTSVGISPNQILSALANALDVAQQRSVMLTPVHLGAHQRDCMEVLCLWRRHQEFLDARGCPATIPVNGDVGSFSSLCRRAKVAADPSDVLAILQRFGAVEVTTDDLAVPKTPTFILGASGVGVAYDGVLKQLAGFVRVIEHNLLEVGSEQVPRFERACSVVVPAELLPVVERLVRERGQDFVDVIDEWLERSRDLPSVSNSFVEVGAGAYFVHLGAASAPR